MLRRLDEITAAGRWAFGFVSFEAGSALDPAMPRRSPVPGLPLAWFGIADEPHELDPVWTPDPFPSTGPWQPDRDPDGHHHDVEAVRSRIAAGETYQTNLTMTLHALAPSDPRGLYAAMATEQGGAYNAYLDLGTTIIASASPELFHDVSGDVVRMRPMKGTAARGATTAADARVRDRLLADPKERAENIMIVDLVRNDLGRLAVPGTVRVDALCTPERFGTVWQLTSDVSARLPPGIGWCDLFAATFPCGSVTGAPKLRSMEILGALEGRPRGVYCGAIGWVGPGRGRFSVGIRTLVVDATRGRSSYGVGSGITWGSDAAAEHRELRAKSHVLTRRTRPAGLFETFAVVDGCPRHLDDHLRRLLDSAGYFDIPTDETELRAAVVDALARPGTTRTGSCRMRLRLGVDGRIDTSAGPLPESDSRPVRLTVDDRPFDHPWTWRHHKTVHRDAYDSARARHPDADDVILVNDDGELTETTIATLAVRVDGRWCTPAASAGLLPGVARSRAVTEGVLHEGPLRPEDLEHAEDVAVLSSLRGWRRAAMFR